jgi:predicted dehydrogenase
MMKKSVINRRQFVQRSGMAATATLAATAAPGILRGKEGADEFDPVRVAQIGIGTRGLNLIRVAGSKKSCTVRAICDVYKPHLERGIPLCGNPDVKTFTDYREMLNDPKIEAVIIVTPDHWHEKMLLDCVAAGKDVYCEKGWTMSIAAAKRMRQAIKDAGAVMQLGHQGRQLAAADEGARMINEGEIGEVTLVNTGRFFNGSAERPPWRWYGNYSNYERPDPNQVIRDLDWEAWLGNCPQIDFNERHFWHWRCYWPYGTGQCGDLLSHELDQVQAVLKYGIPDSCVTQGRVNFWKDDREVPDTWHSTYVFEDEDCMVTYEGSQCSRRGQSPEYIGTKGRLIYNSIGQNASQFEIYPDQSAHRLFRHKRVEPSYFFAPGKEHRRPDHMQDFFNCVRTRKKPRCNEDEAFIETATMLMALESYRQNRQVRWDPEKEDII